MQALTEVEIAREVIAEACKPAEPIPLKLNEAQDCVLAENVFATESMPPFDRSAVDGYAVNGGGNSFQLKGVIETGVDNDIVVQPNEAYRIYTGGKVPEGAQFVYMQEVCEVDSDTLRISEIEGPDFIRKKGQDIEEGDFLLGFGSELHSGNLSLLASNGSVVPKIFPLPTVMHITTGNEIVSPENTPKSGQIRDSNSILIQSLLKEEGIPLIKQKHILDDLETAKNVVNDFLASSCRILLVSGGASVGDFDFGQQALESQGFEILLSRLNSRPGKPMVFAKKGDQVAFVLPGNPLSHFVVFHLFVKVALCSMSGKKTEKILAKAKLSNDFIYKPNPRTTFCPAHYYWRDGELTATALPWNNSGDLRCLQNTNAFLQRSKDQAEVKAGEEVEIIIIS